ncbi:GNAT family N-acetyltransferase [Virgibacillus pantothenticus]|uniref:GNAT family N-acetyltransferase n=1 Tax=Virgibacillus pantothenticus TaxID=1473 RepID=UPI00147D3A46|nr:GNAT family N-acetyltransferase [Virgibacillus pantothenticus]GIP63153.1 hypothetical protein J32TS6_17080 [Virgibacillus pantothenticus]
MKNKLLVTHMEKGDIDERISLLFDYHVQKNINHSSVLMSKNEIRESHFNTINDGQEFKRYYVIRTLNQALVGYCWITSIDWIEQTCELSISILPEFRVGYGLLALLEMYDYLYKSLNIRAVINQILEGNKLLRSERSLRNSAIKSVYDSFTFGKYRSAFIWTQTLEQHRELNKLQKEKSNKLKNKLERMIIRKPWI